MGKENVVQGAIMAALEVYGDRHGLHTDGFTPYANQQGIGSNQFIADLVMQIARRSVLLLEVKELDLSTGTLPAYNLKQHGDDILWEIYLKIPILYGYAAIEQLAYIRPDRGNEWPQKTLLNIKLSKPSALLPLSEYGKKTPSPATSSHSNLLEWLLRDPPVTAALATLAALGNLPSHELRNKQLVILAAGGTLQAHPAAGVAAVVREFLDTSVEDEAEATSDASFATEQLRTLRDDLRRTIDQQRRLLDNAERGIAEAVDRVLRDVIYAAGSKEEEARLRAHWRLQVILSLIRGADHRPEQDEPRSSRPRP